MDRMSGSICFGYRCPFDCDEYFSNDRDVIYLSPDLLCFLFSEIFKGFSKKAPVVIRVVLRAGYIMQANRILLADIVFFFSTLFFEKATQKSSFGCSNI
jgi:hypothetical protein